VRGELDLIGLDGDALVFVEVKARRAGSAAGPETPALAVGPRKQRKLRSLAAAWLRDRGYDVPRHRELRFDVVGVRLDPAGRPVEYEHLRSAF
jgi:putative endonuclease